jgi:ketosteroid isomerase-like protein
MTRENVDLMRGLYEAFAQRGIAAIPTDLIEPDFELALFPPFPSGPFQGQEGIVDFAREFDAMVEEYRLEPEEFIDIEDRVAVVVRFRGHCVGGGVPADERIAHVWTVRRGKLTRAGGVVASPVGAKDSNDSQLLPISLKDSAITSQHGRCLS